MLAEKKKVCVCVCVVKQNKTKQDVQFDILCRAKFNRYSGKEFTYNQLGMHGRVVYVIDPP